MAPTVLTASLFVLVFIHFAGGMSPYSIVRGSLSAMSTETIIDDDIADEDDTMTVRFVAAHQVGKLATSEKGRPFALACEIILVWRDNTSDARIQLTLRKNASPQNLIIGNTQNFDLPKHQPYKRDLRIEFGRAKCEQAGEYTCVASIDETKKRERSRRLGFNYKLEVAGC